MKNIYIRPYWWLVINDDSYLTYLEYWLDCQSREEGQRRFSIPSCRHCHDRDHTATRLPLLLAYMHRSAFFLFITSFLDGLNLERELYEWKQIFGEMFSWNHNNLFKGQERLFQGFNFLANKKRQRMLFYFILKKLVSAF